MKASTKIIKLIKAIEEAKLAEKAAKKAVEKAEEAIIKMMGETIKTTTVESDGKVYTITLGENCRYSVSEDGKRKLQNEVPFDSPLWDKKPCVAECQKDETFKEYVVRKDYGPKVLITSKQA